MAKQDFKVARAHDGDRFYKVGDTRTADPTHVADLVARGVLVDADKGKPTKKAAPKRANKAAPPAANKAEPGEQGTDTPAA